MDILVAVDQSSESQNALTNAIDIVSSFGGTIIAVHADDGDRNDSESILEQAAERAEGRKVELETKLLRGDPIQEITAYAEEQDVDVIYVGHRGLSSERDELSGEHRGSLGSVAKGLVESTAIPVTVFDRGL